MVPVETELVDVGDDQSIISIVDDDEDYVHDFYLEDVAPDSIIHPSVAEGVHNADNVLHENTPHPSVIFNNSGEHSKYIRSRCNETHRHRHSLLWNDRDFPLLDLYHIHRRCRAPIGLFDETLIWLEKHWASLFDVKTSSLNALPRRETFVKNMYNKVHGTLNVKRVKPKLIKVGIPNFNTSINATMFDFREVLVDMLSNEDIMKPNNLLFFDNNDPSKVHPVGSPFCNVITSDVFRRAHKRLCTNKDDVLWPLVVYNDEINFDSHGKLKLDPLQVAFLRSTQHIRNQPFAWRTFGIVHNLESRMFPGALSASQKLEIQHKVLAELYKMVGILQKEGGIPWKLKLQNGSEREVRLKIYIQMVIGDTKGHDQHCGRMGSHAVGMKQCVRDCNVTMDDCDNVNHKCCFRKVSDFDNLDVKGCNELSFHKISNCYNKLDLGDEIHGIFGATPGEPLHVLDSGLCPLISDVFREDLSMKCFNTLERSVMNIVASVQRQTAAKDMPSINAFRNGLVKVSSLTGKEKSARLFAMFLALMSSDCCRLLSTSEEKGVGNHNVYGEDRVEQWLKLIENTLCFRMWLKEDVIPASQLYSDDWNDLWKSCFPEDMNGDGEENENGEPINNLPTVDDNMVEGSPAQSRIIQFLDEYHKLISVREGNGLKIPKFHLCFHFARNICRHGPVCTYDGARPEANAKELAKCPGLRTQKHHKSISYQTAKRYHEDLTMLEAERLLLRQCSYFDCSYSYFNQDCKKELSLHTQQEAEEDGHDISSVIPSSRSSRFTMKFISNRRTNDDGNVDINLRTYKIEWSNSNTKPRHRMNDEMLQCLAYWLWIDPRGGRITQSSVLNGFTEVQIGGGHILRCHPSYRSEECWYDWVLVKWDGYDEPIPARAYMFFSTVGCDFETENDVREDYGMPASMSNLLPNSTNVEEPFNTDFIQSHKYWAIVHSAISTELEHQFYPTRYHLKSKIAKRVQMESKKFRIVPLDSIVGPCYGTFNKSLTDSDFDDTAIIVDPPKMWAEKFIDSVS